MSKVWLTKESKWTDKECGKHKHDFSERVLIHVSGTEPSKHYFNSGFYTADKCRFCRSFVNAKYISDEEVSNYKGLEVYEYKSSKQMVGFESLRPTY